MQILLIANKIINSDVQLLFIIVAFTLNLRIVISLMSSCLLGKCRYAESSLSFRNQINHALNRLIQLGVIKCRLRLLYIMYMAKLAIKVHEIT